MAKSLYTKVELTKKSKPELEKLFDAHGLEFEEDFTPLKTDLIDALLDLGPDDELTDPNDEELDDEEGELEDDEADDEVDDEEDDELDDEELDPELPEDDEEDDIVEAKPAKKTRTAKAKAPAKEVDPNAPETFAAKQVATMLGTEAKTLRQFLRSPASTLEAVGSGGRYEFTETDIPQIKKEFTAWKEGHASRGAKRAAGKASTPADVEVIEEVEEIEELEELDDEIDDDDLELDDEEDDEVEETKPAPKAKPTARRKK